MNVTKLKVITLVMNRKLEGEYAGSKQFQALDDNGKALCSRYESKACSGKTYIAALVTINSGLKYRYSIQNMFTAFSIIGNKSKHELRKPYAIAVLEEHKEAYQNWVATLDNQGKPKAITH